MIIITKPDNSIVVALFSDTNKDTQQVYINMYGVYNTLIEPKQTKTIDLGSNAYTISTNDFAAEVMNAFKYTGEYIIVDDRLE